MRTRRLTAQVHWPAGHEQLGPQEQVHPGARWRKLCQFRWKGLLATEVRGAIPIVKMVSI